MIATVIILAVLGTIALILEVFLPGGILGVLGGIAVAASVALVMTAPPFSSMALVARVGLAALILAVGGGAFATCMRFFQQTILGKRLTLGEAIPSGAGVDDLSDLVGRRGTAVTDLLPGGRVDIGGRHLDAISHAGAVRAGDPVEVTGTSGGHLEIRVVRDAPPAEPTPPADRARELADRDRRA